MYAIGNNLDVLTLINFYKSIQKKIELYNLYVMHDMDIILLDQNYSKYRKIILIIMLTTSMRSARHSTETLGSSYRVRFGQNKATLT